MAYHDLAIARYQLKNIAQWACADAFITGLAYTLMVFVHAISAPLSLADTLEFILLVVVLSVISLYLSGVYRRIWSQTSGHGITILIRASFLAATVTCLATLSLTSPPLPVGPVLIANLLAFGGYTAIRYQSRLISGALWRWRAIWYHEFPGQKQKMLIIGAGEAGQVFAMRFKYHFTQHEYQVIGFVDDDPKKQGMYVEGCPVLGNRSAIPAIAEKYQIDVIVFAIHKITGNDFRSILSYCEGVEAQIKIIPDLVALMKSNGGQPLLRDIQPEDLIGRSAITRYEGVDMSPVTGKIVLVTGAAGSIGSELARQILEYAPEKVILLDNNESGLFDLMTELRSRKPTAKIIPALVDVSVQENLDEIFRSYRIQVVFHAAAYKHVPMLESYPDEAVRVNIQGTYHLLKLSDFYKVERFVLISTDKAVEPSCVMGASKRICELMLRAYSHDPCVNTIFTSVRFGNVLGSRGSVVPTFERQIANGGPVTITHPDMARYFMSIAEAVNLVIHAACLTKGNDVFLLRMGEEVRIQDIAERMIRLRGLRPHKDIPIQYTGIRPGEKLSETLYHTEAEIPGETIHPFIFRLNGCYQNPWDPQHFLKSVEELVSNGLSYKVSPLDQLLALASELPSTVAAEI